MGMTELIAAYLTSIIWLGVSSIYDICCRRVPNILNGFAAIIGLSLPWILSDGLDLFSSYFGGILGLLILLPPYALGVIGAGDVKVLSVLGLFVGIKEMLPLTIYIAISGGILALVYLIHLSISKFLRGKYIGLSAPSSIQLPYVVAIFGGFIYMLIAERTT